MVNTNKLKEEARKLNEKNNLGSFALQGNFALCRAKDSSKVKYMYKCPECGFEEEKEEELGFPYVIKCPKCKKIIFKSTKPRGRRKKE